MAPFFDIICDGCDDDLKNPVCLPCGHVFCEECVFIHIPAAKPRSPIRQCPNCRSLYNITAPDLKIAPSNKRPFVTTSVRPLHMDAKQSNFKAESRSSVPPCSSCSSSSIQTSVIQSSQPTAGLSNDKALSEIARLRGENNALRNQCSMWRKRAEAHGEANLNLLKFAQAIRDQASQIARDRNELEQRCFMLKLQLDGEGTYSDEMQKFAKSSHPTAMGPDPGLSKQMGEDQPVSLPPLSSPRLASMAGLDSKRPRVSVDGAA